MSTPGGKLTIDDQVGDSDCVQPQPEECNKEDTMPATDLSENVSNHLLTQRLATNQEVSASMSQGHAFVMEQGRLAHLKDSDEVGVIEGRSVSGVLATPVASPATQA